MAGKRGDQMSVASAPQARSAVAAAGQDAFAVGADGDAADVARMSGERAEVASGLHVPHVRNVAPARDDDRSMNGEARGDDLLASGVEPRDQGARGGIAQLGCGTSRRK